MITAVDTNILLDILLPGAAHAVPSKELLDQALQEGALVLSEVVYAELVTQFPGRESLDKFLTDTGIRLQGISREGLGVAAEAWRRYRERRGDAVACPRCGHRYQVVCPSCGQVRRVRQHILADFLIGGHAAANADMLLSRDRGFYRTYFPDVRVLPSLSPMA